MAKIVDKIIGSKNILKSTLIISAILALMSLLVDLFFIRYKYPHLSGYLCNFAVECLGVIVTLFVIQRVLEKHNESKEKELERLSILKRNEIIAIYIKFYKQFLRCVVTPLDDGFKNVSFPIEFTIKDMLQNLHNVSGYITVLLTRPSIELFYTHELNLRNGFILAIDNIEFKHYPKIKELMLDYIKMSLNYDVRDFVLNGKQMKFGNKSVDEITKELSPKIDEHYEMYKRGELKGNLRVPYCILYDLMKAEQDIIVRYLQEIERLKK